MSWPVREPDTHGYAERAADLGVKLNFHQGPLALAEFQAEKLLLEIQQTCPSVKGIEARYVHFYTDVGLSQDEQTLLDALLSYGDDSKAQDSAGVSVTVVPRLGTISPWSSKATDILSNCGLSKVGRVERGVRYTFLGQDLELDELAPAIDVLHDRMVESVVNSEGELEGLFDELQPATIGEIDVLGSGADAIKMADAELGLALVDDEISYLVQVFSDLNRNPTDAELMMFSVVNSEHCRHKVFNADWIIDSEQQPKSLFQMIKNTYENHPTGTKSAYHDNGAVLTGNGGEFFHPGESRGYEVTSETVDIVIKVETHNHPTAIAPVPGAATGSGGEIRDEGATGRGAQPKAGLTGFSVSNLHLAEAEGSWENNIGKPDRLVSSQQVMIDGPLGGAAFNNEFGRPNLGGYFRTFQASGEDFEWGYHKPVMIAGGLGAIRPDTIDKRQIEPGDKLVVLGGPSMLIGLGGGAGSSVSSGSQSQDLDFASVQRHNPEMQRRCQEVINSCWRLGADRNPIVSIHDVGAGGLSNAMPELVNDAGLGAVIELREIPIDDKGMSPMQIWSNESQERYVLALRPESVAGFEEICAREKCPYAIIGEATEEKNLLVSDSLLSDSVVDVANDVMLGRPPKMVREYDSVETDVAPCDLEGVDLGTAIENVLSHPAVASKEFLIHIGDRTVGGMTARDQLVGPWQVPVADAAVTHNSFTGYCGEAMAMGERSPVAVKNPAASGRLSVAEAVTNLLSADVQRLSDIKLSANWMVAADSPNQDQALFETVKALGEEFCSELNLTIPVGKDSTSMKASWSDELGANKTVVSPLTAVITGFAPVGDVRSTVTPELRDKPGTVIVLLGAGEKSDHLGGSILEQVQQVEGGQTPDIAPSELAELFNAISDLKKQDIVMAFHDRSDGGLLAALVEMGFASQLGLDIDLGSGQRSVLDELFNESIGALIQISEADLAKVVKVYPQARVVARPNIGSQVKILKNGIDVYEGDLIELKKVWSRTSFEIKKLRDNPECASEEFDQISLQNQGFETTLSFETSSRTGIEPDPNLKVAVLREQGVNGHIEMAAAFHAAGFTAVDVHMTDLRNGTQSLDEFVGLAAAGGFSYGDVLGAGAGWSKSILFDKNLSEIFRKFFERQDTFSLGLCNGCQMMSQLSELIPGAQDWPSFEQNLSQRFEARLSTVEIMESNSIFLKGMAGSRLQVPLAHGEGRVVANQPSAQGVIRFVDNNGGVTETYPFNPSGSVGGLNGFTSLDGRATIMMPHPERAFRTSQLSWHPEEWGEESPWFQMFRNAFVWAKAQQ